MTTTATQRSDVESAAILLLTLGEADAAQVLKHLDAKAVQKVGAAMAQINGVTHSDVTTVLDRFSGDVAQKTSVGVDASNYIRKMLTEALGSEKANGVLDRIVGGRAGSGLDSLRWMEAKNIAQMLRTEHPQIIANVFCYLEADQAANVLKELPENMRSDIVMRIATLDGVHPSALIELDKVLEQQFSGDAAAKSAGRGGAKVAAAILNRVGAAVEGPVLKEIAATDAVLSEKLQSLMFIFEDLSSVPDRDLQTLLREVPGDKLILALKGAAEPLREKFFTNMSSRVAEQMREDLAAKGPTKLSDVEAAQKEILAVARRMADEGTLQLGGSAGGDYV